jgi:hypothetical protein
MRGLFYLTAGLATANAVALQPRENIPQPAPASAYVATPPNPKGKSQPYVLRDDLGSRADYFKDRYRKVLLED